MRQQEKLASMLEREKQLVLRGIPSVIDDAADWVMATIKRRTLRGVGTNQRKFVPYSVSYARRKKGGRRQPVTLVDAGRMLNDLYVKKEGKRYNASVRFRTKEMEDRGRFHHFGQGRVPVRRWFDLTKRELAKLQGRMRMQMVDIVKTDRRFRNRLFLFK